MLQRIAETYDPTPVVWRAQKRVELGPFFVRTSLEMKNIGHQCSLDRISLLEDVQASWLLLVHCAVARANCMTRVVQTGNSGCQ